MVEKNHLSLLIRNFRGPLVALLFVVFAAAPYGCSRSPFDGLDEGKVVYDVTYENADANPMMKAMMPSEVTTYFTGDKTCTVISMGLNMMETRLISDAVNYRYTTLIAAMGRKVAMVMDEKQVHKNFLQRVSLLVTYTDETKEIAGINCRQAIITDSTNHSYPVYYTTEIAVKEPNWSSPFNVIDGMLLEYSIRFGEMIMNLKAKEIVNTKNDLTLFEIPQDYEIIKDPSEFKFGF